MESALTLNSLSFRQLLPILHPPPPTFLHSQTRRRRRLFIHSNASTPQNPLFSSSSSSSLRKIQSFKPPTNIFISTCKTLSFAIFLAFLSFIPPIPTPRLLPAAAAAEKTDKGDAFTDHEFSSFTRRLLSVVSVLLSRVEDVKSGKGDMNGVKKALKEVKASRRMIQEEVIGNLNAELNELRRANMELSERSEKVAELAKAAMDEMDELSDGFEMEELEKRIGDLEREYNDLVVKVEEIEDRMMRRETLTYSVGVRELSFIERESELLVQRLGRRIMEVERMRYDLSRNYFTLLVHKVLDMVISNVCKSYL